MISWRVSIDSPNKIWIFINTIGVILHITTACISCAENSILSLWRAVRPVSSIPSLPQTVATYHRCITYLHDTGFINYQPSYNPLAGSKVFITEFLKPDKARSESSLLTGSLPVSKMERNRSTSSLNIEQLMDPSINIKNSINIKPVNGVVPQPVLSRFKKKDEVKADSSEQKKGFRKKTQSNFRPGENIPPPKSEIQLFFAEKNAPAEEAEKFFNHYEANGWQVGGRSRMKNWQAAARNWMLNSGKFNTENIGKMAQVNVQILKPGHLSATLNKSYQDKL